MKNWIIVLFVPCFFLGVWYGWLLFGIPKVHEKHPISVECYWQTNGYASYPSMDADSVKGDTIYKDGLYIVNKNIINVKFK